MATKILVADDSATIQKVIKIAFARLSYEIMEAFSYPQAANLIKTDQAPSMVILDASLPGLQGPAGVSKLMGEKKLPILLLVGTYDTIDEDSYRNAGFSHFLRKPFESTDIVAAVEKLIPPVAQPTPTSVPSAISAPTPAAVPPPLPYIPLVRPPSPPPPQPMAQPHHPPEPLHHPPEPPQHPPELAPLPFDFKREPPPVEFKLQEMTIPQSLPHPPQGIVPLPVPPSPAQVPSNSLHPKPQRPPMAFTLEEPKDLPKELPKDLPGTSHGADESGFALPQVAAANLHADIRAEIMQVIKNDLPLLVSLAVGEYCERHFGPLAKEVIQAELRRLADEKTRQLVDN